MKRWKRQKKQRNKRTERTPAGCDMGQTDEGALTGAVFGRRDFKGQHGRIN
ncbi:MAG TPA: hypothetical protein VKL21_01250 [Candidatus Methanoperedens sp.]|nr:hypothetical protein [Candidatus Methanoperedens sp.]